MVFICQFHQSKTSRFFLKKSCFPIMHISNLVAIFMNIWGDKNLRIIREKLRHPKRVTVWSALWKGGVIRPYLIQRR